ncbi:hypothetical protein [Xanthomonas translucens]|uniref:hypothetical protein n=1 Tax=Xanthomonas campestris pv. translucens TaxID=343 RepID=UPI000B256F3C|nr:hypothetical protein [Xanthomonas translucens]MCT8281794.1 hypothetical protein [Xanthomonas translucens pv. undulosa]MCT8316452.1 hypothetical protein [Xanthomonas translucens pv. undulosa]UKE38306.1 hypothetical protein KCU58_11070 [Xanthomonas translucens pv. undulosa]
MSAQIPQRSVNAAGELAGIAVYMESKLGEHAKVSVLQLKSAVDELIDFVRASPCHCSAALAPLPAIQCERCRLLARCGATP